MHHAAIICLLCLPGFDEPLPQINPMPRPTLREVVAEWDFSEGTKGWFAEARCELTTRDGNLLVHTTGKDPYMHARVDTSGGQMALEYRARGTAPGPAQVYWITRESPRRGDDKARSLEVIPDNEWHEYKVDFHAPGHLTDIRLDPADGAGEIEIDWIRLVHLGEHPLSIDRIALTEAGAEFTIKNHGTSPRQFTAAGQVLLLQPGTEKVIAIGTDAKQLIEPIRIDLQAEGLPDVSRSLFVVHPEAPVQWLDMPLEGGKLQVAPDGKAARVFRNDQVVALLAPLVHCDYRIPSFNLTSTPQSLQFRGEGVALTLSTAGNEIHIVIESESVCEGPVVRVLGGLEQGLLAGLEHLGKGEHSSTKLDVETEAHLRFAPKPLDVTMPLMSFVTDRASVSLTWDDMGLQPIFATPNFFDAADDHRMALQGSTIKAVLRVAGGSLEDQIVWAVKRRGLPPLPDAPRSSEAQYRLCLQALNGPLRSTEGWGHCVEDRWPRQYFADMVSTLFRLTGQVPRRRDFTMRGAHIANESIFFLTNQAFEWKEKQLAQIDGLLKQQQEDGSFRYQGKFAQGHHEDTASGVCARPAAGLLEYAWITADPRALEAGVRTLEYMKRFRTPRGAQVWEIPLHTPDQLASAYLVWAYVRGYELTGDKSYLDEARRWAISGVPFVYQWGNQPIMVYGTVPVLGATNWRAPVWFGLPVQWVGLVYAYALTKLAPYDDTLDWKHLAWGILIAGEQMQYPDGDYAGLLPDALALETQERRPWTINPCALVSLRLVLEGKLDAISVAADKTHRVAAPFPVTLQGDQAIIEGENGVTYQVIVDGRRIIGVRSQGKDVVELKE
ncbi:MAG: hypothetical protein GXX96_01565 [Planctomycetaceae bacterium]|nr:hypothetical protein [Planctomycetaceae bacterium]